METNLINRYLETLEEEFPIRVSYEDGITRLIGNGTPKFNVTIKELPSKSKLLKSTTLALAEAYMKKDIMIEGDLYGFLNLFLSQMDQFSTNYIALRNLYHASSSITHQRDQVCSHYDLGNEFYKLWLDETMSYSCGYFPEESTSLYEAQMNKIHYILRKLNLKEDMSLLDIGCGWGCLLIEAAKKYKIKGVGITLSQEQFQYFSNKIKEEHLEKYLQVKLMDYRMLKDCNLRFDRVVSVGMLEHVGRGQYDQFFDQVNTVLKYGGVFLLHYISSLTEHKGDAFIRKYIFPGGVIPSLREILSCSAEKKFYTVDVESLRRHYVKTLLCWNENFKQVKGKVTEMFDEEFTRMWELYLCSCAAGFQNGFVDLHQVLLTKGVNNSLPMTRDYMMLD